MKQLGVFLLPPGQDARPSQGPPSTQRWREALRELCVMSKNTLSPARAQTQTKSAVTLGLLHFIHEVETQCKLLHAQLLSGLFGCHSLNAKSKLKYCACLVWQDSKDTDNGLHSKRTLSCHLRHTMHVEGSIHTMIM